LLRRDSWVCSGKHTAPVVILDRQPANLFSKPRCQAFWTRQFPRFFRFPVRPRGFPRSGGLFPFGAPDCACAHRFFPSQLLKWPFPLNPRIAQSSALDELRSTHHPCPHTSYEAFSLDRTEPPRLYAPWSGSPSPGTTLTPTFLRQVSGVSAVSGLTLDLSSDFSLHSS